MLTPLEEFRALSPGAIKSFEDRLRRAAKRQGLILIKSRRRDPRARDYGRFWLHDEQNRVVLHNQGNGVGLLDVEAYLLGVRDERVSA